MNVNHQEAPIERQSAGSDPKATKRNSGLFSFLRWFKNSSTSSESVNSDTVNNSATSGSCDSINSTYSTGTVASFSFVPATAYKNHVAEKCIAPGPETDTYKARLKQRDKTREKDKNVTLRKKYNLFFNRDTLLKPSSITDADNDDNSKSLPLMTKVTMDKDEERMHRRTASESSKLRKAGAYCHVKGKRKAPQPPSGTAGTDDGMSTASLRRKKRLAPAPPPSVSAEKILNTLAKANKEQYETIEYVDADVIFNDSLKLDHGILKPAKETDLTKTPSTQNISTSNSPNASARSSYVETPVSPRPWYKRNTSRDSGINFKKDKEGRHENKYEPVEKLPEVQYTRNSGVNDVNIEETKIDRKKEDRRKSGLSFLTNISELDREASEIIKKEHEGLTEMPAFMRPKQEHEKNADSLASPKRKSAKDLIAKFNAITNVTKVTVNTAFFGSRESAGAVQKEKRDYFGRKTEDQRKETKRRPEQKKTVVNENGVARNNPLAKSESASAIKCPSEPKETPKIERKSWFCPKCSLENDYWRIICYVCSTIKPYFDDLTTPPPVKIAVDSNNKNEAKLPTTSSGNNAKTQKVDKLEANAPDRNLERSKTQIGFSALARYNETREKKLEKSVSLDEKEKQSPENKKEERDKLIKMLIEMKNSLPKRRLNSEKLSGGGNRTSVIEERPEIVVENEMTAGKSTIAKETGDVEQQESLARKEGEQEQLKKQPEAEQKVTEIIVATTETIYENIKVKRTENPKPIKVSSSAQTSAVVRKSTTPSIAGAVKKETTRASFEPMKPTDFADIYNEKTGNNVRGRTYANLAVNDDLSLFVNMPRRFGELKNNFDLKNMPNNADTLEINRLLRRLETAIAKGELTEASIFARELAQLKVNCSVIRQKVTGAKASLDGAEPEFTIEMFVEDRRSHRGPFPIQVTANQTVAELKAQVEREFEIPTVVQRWILGKELAADDKSTLKDHHVTEGGCPVFLYLVAPAKESTSGNSRKNEIIDKAADKNAEKVKVVDYKIKEEVKEQLQEIPATVSKIEIVIQKTEVPKKSDSKQIPKQQASTSRDEQVKEDEKRATSTKGVVAFAENPPPEASARASKLSAEEDFDEYDCKTLRPQTNDWECKMCTLLNPLSSNVCAVCATVRQKEESEAASAQQSKGAKRKAPQPQGKNKEQNDQHYLQLVNLDNADLVENAEAFECVVCLTDIQPGQGVTLRECLHQFCKLCLAQTIEFTEEAEIKCLFRDDQYSCDIALQDREIKALVSPAIYDQYLARSVAQAENKMDKSFHCKTPDCKGWCVFEDNVNEFRCPVCRKINCLTCQAIHFGMNCKQYQEKMNAECETDESAKQTREMLEEMVNKGEALTCPACQVVLMKKWGCDWVRCSMCRTEICWVTRGPRWGPGGKGDTTGGCKCGVNGVKCHPQCNYCH